MLRTLGSAGAVDLESIKFLLMSGGGAALCLFLGFKKLRQYRTLRDTALSKAASAPQGLVELEGFAWPNDDATLSVQQLPVVHHRLSVQKRVQRGKESHWETVWSKRGPGSFLICDDTGACVLKVERSSITCESREVSWDKLTQAERDVLANMIPRWQIDGFPPTEGILGFLTNSRFQICESWIAVGQFVFASGSFKGRPGGPLAITDSRLQYLVSRLRGFKSSPARFLGLLDANKDGKISAREFQQGFSVAGRRAFAMPDEAVDTAIKADRAKGLPTDVPYLVHGELTTEAGDCLISTSGQEELMRSGLLSAGLLLLLGSGCLWILIHLVRAGN